MTNTGFITTAAIVKTDKAEGNKKLVSIIVLMCLILLTHNITRSIKDSLIAKEIGPEIISFISLWIELPLSLCLTLFYIKFNKKYSSELLFKFSVIFFTCFFLVFAYFIYPSKNLLHPNDLYIKQLLKQYPYFYWFLKVWSQWTLIMFFVISELWPIIAFSTFFWQLVNNKFTISEAQNFYPLLNLCSNFNLLLTGILLSFITLNLSSLSYYIGSKIDFSDILKTISILVGVINIFCIILYLKINQRSELISYFTPKHNISTIETLKIVLSSSYLLAININIISYTISINLLECCWLVSMNKLFNTDNILHFQGKLLLYIGVFSIIFAIIGQIILNQGRWVIGILFTPIIIFITGLSFVLFLLIDSDYSFSNYSTSQLALLLSLPIIMGRSAKYSIFDITKEMAYIPLSSELKTNGKAAAELLGVKIGKSSGALIQFIIFTFNTNTNYSTTILCFCFSFICISFMWFTSSFILIFKNKKTIF
jgi:ATP/ADP translocase